MNLSIILLTICSPGIADSQLTSNNYGYEVLASGEGKGTSNLEAASIGTINAGMNDAWFDPATSGQGFFVTVFPDNGVVSLAWFTYDTELPPDDATANLGDNGHRWLTALGPITDNTAIMPIEMTSGGIFDTASEITRTTLAGTIILSFSSCNSGTVEYDIPSINRQGIVNIQRVAEDNVELCEMLNRDTRTGTPEMCDRWNADRADLDEGSWSGSVSQCDAGDISDAGRANALKLVNLYRFMAGLAPVATSPTRDQGAQECALMMDANNQTSHSPPNDWLCYTSDGDEAAGKSNIIPTPGVEAVDHYMTDRGSATTMGHRRWILSNSLGPIGLGSTSGASCMWTIGGSGSGGNEWTAWPPPGKFPVEAVAPQGISIDDTGWTIQSSDASLNGAQVSIKDDGNDRPVTVTNLLSNYGSLYAIRMVPQGWTTTAGHTYEVSVTGIDSPFNYQVEVVACQ